MRVLLPWLLLGWSLLFWPGLRRRMLLSSRSFLLRGLLVLRGWSLLGQRLYLLYRLHGRGRAFLRGWPGLRNLLGDACSRYRPFSLRRL